MPYVRDDYTPNAKSRDILARAWEHVQSIPYAATLRWLFYRLLQEGLYSDKKDYRGPYMQLFSRARHNEWEGWRPDTLVDDMHGSIVRGDGFETPADWLDAISTELGCNLSHWYAQDYYVELWFEAAAMIRQFKHYTKNITLVPFGGMPSIAFKYEIAQRLDDMADKYNHGVKVIYFGDLDPAGMTIAETSVSDIRKWCGVDFEFIRAGLNPGDEVRYRIPENFEHPGAYQWEALNDAAAGELITLAVVEYVNMDIVDQVAARAEKTALAFRKYAEGFVLGGAD